MDALFYFKIAENGKTSIISYYSGVNILENVFPYDKYVKLLGYI